MSHPTKLGQEYALAARTLLRLAAQQENRERAEGLRELVALLNDLMELDG